MIAEPLPNHALNRIAQDQDLPESIDLLRARNRVYGCAKSLQSAFVVATITIGVLGAVVSADHKPVFGLLGIFALLLDVLILDPYIKRLCKLGAQLGEQFDVTVLRLPGNPFAADNPVDPEVVRRFSIRPLHADREKQLLKWYDPRVSELPLETGRLVCQRTNINYDARLRSTFADRALYGVLALAALLYLVCLHLRLEHEVTIFIFSSLLPAINWVAREIRKNAEAASNLEKLRIEFARIWSGAMAGATSDELLRDARRLQDGIFQHRTNTTLISDWFYQRFRPANEDEAGAAADRLVRDARAAMETAARR